MLNSLHINNIALISSLSIEFEKGLNILTGETGAGKSILIDSIDFILGGRADKTLIRHGESKASVEAVFSFETQDESRCEFFESNGIEFDDTIILRRVMQADGKNECRINGRLVNLVTLKGLTGLLANIYGQNEHQSLLKVSNHIGILDGLDGNISQMKAQVTVPYQEFKSAVSKLASFGDRQYREQRISILNFQIQEIESANLKDGEEEELRVIREKLNNIGKITTLAADAYNVLEGDEINAVALANTALKALRGAANYDAVAEELAERLTDIKSQMSDLVSGVSSFLDGLDYDEGQADEIESRLDQIKLLKKKYGRDIPAITEYLQKARLEYDTLLDSENLLNALTKQKNQAYIDYVKKAKALSVLRKKTAQKFEHDIKQHLCELGMSGTTFKVMFLDDCFDLNDVEPQNDLAKCGLDTSRDTSIYRLDISHDVPDMSLDLASEVTMRADGVDKIEFYISPNVGEPLKPLTKIISGGEMSRFMLALKSIISGLDNINIMIFDEIDTGISGKIADIVAEKLWLLASKGKQVLAVTHLPQLTSFADTHFLIDKQTIDKKTITNVKKLGSDESISEIARLSGGADTKLALLHAKEIKERANHKKSGKKAQK